MRPVSGTWRVTPMTNISYQDLILMALLVSTIAYVGSIVIQRENIYMIYSCTNENLSYGNCTINNTLMGIM